NARSVKKGVGISTRRGALSLLLAATMASSAIAAGPFTFRVTGSMATGRHNPNAVLLSNGTVLVAGGVGGGNFLTIAELYDPATGTWSNTGSLSTMRAGHRATLLSNGKVLVTAGYSGGNNGILGTAEIYDPSSGTWSGTASMITPRIGHIATLLANG